MNLVKIGNTELPIIEIRGQRAVTLAMVDQAHERPEGTARKRFNDNKRHMVEGEDFEKMSASEFRTRFQGVISDRATEDVTILFREGYLMLVKSLTDDLAWTVQRQLVKGYFRPDVPIDLTTALNDPVFLKQALLENLEKRQELEEDKRVLAERVEILESFFIKGESLSSFGKRLNGVRSDLMTNYCVKLGWIYNSERDHKRSPKYRVYHTARNTLLFETPHPISGEGAVPFIKYTPKLLLKGSQFLYDLYLSKKLPMKAGWDGQFTMMKLVADGGVARVVDMVTHKPATLELDL